MRHAKKKYRQDKTEENKHNEFRRLRQLKCELLIRIKALYYKKKLNEGGNDSSKFYGQLNFLIGKNKNSNILPSGKMPLPITNDFENFSIDQIGKKLEVSKIPIILKIFFRFQNSLQRPCMY